MAPPGRTTAGSTRAVAKSIETAVVVAPVESARPAEDPPSPPEHEPAASSNAAATTKERIRAPGPTRPHDARTSTDDGTTTCWGSVAGYYPNSIPQPPVSLTVTGLADITAMAIGSYHACALLTNETAACWGGGHFGQLGNGWGDYTSKTPVPVGG